jgi:diacylglycerol kinase (ATP)
MVFIAETINSAIEALCDTVSLEYKVNIKYAKDVSAGAVLVSATVSVITGLIVFLPYIVTLVKNIVW